MSRNKVIGLIAGRSLLGESKIREQDDGLRASMTVLRAVAERGGRVLLFSDPTQAIPLLMTAAEYRVPREVEGGEDTTPPLVILGYLLETDSLEAEILHYRHQEEGDLPTPTFLLELLHEGVFEAAEVANANRFEKRDGLDAVFAAYKPQVVVAVGDSPQMEAALGAAEDYDEENSAPLLWVLGDERRRDRSERWGRIGGFRHDERTPPPMLDGEPVAERFQDENLLALAYSAAEEASMVLAIDQAIEAIFEEPEDPSSDATGSAPLAFA